MGERGDNLCWATVVRDMEEAGELVEGAEEEDEERRCSP